jgi:DNA segregation ATPase FtsK/SpoIIIE, S-DNA-T family
MARLNGSDNKKPRTEGVSLPSETRHGLTVVFLFAFALILGLAFFGLAGSAGDAVRLGLSWGLGYVAYVIPVALLTAGYILLQSERGVRPIQGVGFVLLLLGFAGLFHSALPPQELKAAAREGVGGGYIGYFVFVPLAKALGIWGAIVLLVAVSLAGILVTFETSLSGLMARFRAIISSFRGSFHRTPINTAPMQPENVNTRVRLFQSRTVSELDEEAETEADLAQLAAKPPSPAKQLKLPSPKVEVPIDLLEDRTGKAMAGDIRANQEKIQRTLANFGIEVEMGSVNVGPTVTQYTLKPAEGVKLASITALSNHLALALAAHPIRIEAPIPGQSLVGIEVPNQSVAVVGLKELMLSDGYQKRSSNLTVAIGKDVAGKAWVADIDRMPHLLIAGATGSGKSVCINTILLSLLYNNSPEELKLILVDPKRVELSSYNGVPHLLTPVITEVARTINALKWVVGEMDRRYQLLQQAGKRNIAAFNQNGGEKLPYIVVVVDELADLMAVAAADVESAIIRLAQMARAVGIHLVVATQRPSVDVITGLIKANITTRIAFAVASSTDSRTILDNAGADKLLGRGDCLYVSAELSKPKRLQGAMVSDKEIEAVTDFLKQHSGAPDYNEEVVQKVGRTNGVSGSLEEDGDDMLEEAQALVVRTQKASASFLQRRLRVGYARAARLLDLLEERGVIGPGDGAKPRDVLVRAQDLPNDMMEEAPYEAADESEVAETAETNNSEEDTEPEA